MTISNNCFKQIFQDLFQTRIPTVLPVVNSQLHWFTYIFDFVFELSTRKLRKARGKKLKLPLVAERRDELSVRLVSKDSGLKTQNIAYTSKFNNNISHFYHVFTQIQTQMFNAIGSNVTSYLKRKIRVMTSTKPWLCHIEVYKDIKMNPWKYLIILRVKRYTPLSSLDYLRIDHRLIQ